MCVLCTYSKNGIPWKQTERTSIQSIKMLFLKLIEKLINSSKEPNIL
jgi:hypothetical protein